MPRKSLKYMNTKTTVLVSNVEKLKHSLRDRAETPLTIDGEARTLVRAMIGELKAARDAGHSLESIRILFASFQIEITTDDLRIEIDRELNRLARGRKALSIEDLPSPSKRRYTKKPPNNESEYAPGTLFASQS